MHLSLQSPFPTLREGILRIAAFPGFAPFSWRDGNLARGRDIVFLRRFARLHGLEPVVMFHGFDRLWELPGQDVADVAASGISMRPGCDGAISWSRPYSEVRRTLLVRAGDTEVIHGMQDVQRMSVVPHSAAHQHALASLPKTSELAFIPSLASGIEDLILGNTDAVGTGSISAHFHAERHPGLAAVDVHEGLPPELISFAARAPLVKALDEFISYHGSEY